TPVTDSLSRANLIFSVTDRLLSVERRGPVRTLFFFQAEDGIRDDLVTGVQTCALPIYPHQRHEDDECHTPDNRQQVPDSPPRRRSEERRVGKECRSGGGGVQ